MTPWVLQLCLEMIILGNSVYCIHFIGSLADQFQSGEGFVKCTLCSRSKFARGALNHKFPASCVDDHMCISFRNLSANNPFGGMLDLESMAVAGNLLAESVHQQDISVEVYHPGRIKILFSGLSHGIPLEDWDLCI